MNKNIEHIFKYLSVYMNASLDIHSSFTLVVKRVKGKRLLEALKKVDLDMQKGKPMHESFHHLRNAKFVDDVCWSLISTAEQSGSIPDSFARVSEYVKQHLKMRSSLAGALLYPVGMFLTSISMVYFLITIVFPKIIPLFSSMGVDLPITARIMLGASKVISEWGLLACFVLALLGIASIYLFLRKPEFRNVIQRVYLRFPYIGHVARIKEYQRISMILGLLMQNNKTLLESTLIAAHATSMLPFRSVLEGVSIVLQRGQKMSERLAAGNLFERDWIDLVMVGESTGTLPKTFSDLAAVYSEKYKDAIQMLVRISEPAALLCSAFVVLIVALAVIQPMYSLIQHINQ